MSSMPRYQLVLGRVSQRCGSQQTGEVWRSWCWSGWGGDVHL